VSPVSYRTPSRPGAAEAMRAGIDLSAALDAVRILSPSRDSGLHGEEHWRRVATNGLDLADGVGADRLVAVLFAIFHDSMRFNDGTDPDHGKRGGFLACCLNDQLLRLPEARLDLLHAACAGHTDGRTSDDPTIGACWDADCLDLCRLGDRPDIRLMSTAPGRTLGAQNRARALLTATPDWEAVFARLHRLNRG
jgi:uncharacterized protein